MRRVAAHLVNVSRAHFLPTKVPDLGEVWMHQEDVVLMFMFSVKTGMVDLGQRMDTNYEETQRRFHRLDDRLKDIHDLTRSLSESMMRGFEDAMSQAAAGNEGLRAALEYLETNLSGALQTSGAELTHQVKCKTMMYLSAPATQYPFQKLSPHNVHTKPGITKHMKRANQGSYFFWKTTIGSIARSS